MAFKLLTILLSAFTLAARNQAHTNNGYEKDSVAFKRYHHRNKEDYNHNGNTDVYTPEVDEEHINIHNSDVLGNEQSYNYTQYEYEDNGDVDFMYIITDVNGNKYVVDNIENYIDIVPYVDVSQNHLHTNHQRNQLQNNISNDNMSIGQSTDNTASHGTRLEQGNTNAIQSEGSNSHGSNADGAMAQGYNSSADITTGNSPQGNYSYEQRPITEDPHYRFNPNYILPDYLKGSIYDTPHNQLIQVRGSSQTGGGQAQGTTQRMNANSISTENYQGSTQPQANPNIQRESQPVYQTIPQVQSMRQSVPVISEAPVRRTLLIPQQNSVPETTKTDSKTTTKETGNGSVTKTDSKTTTKKGKNKNSADACSFSVSLAIFVAIMIFFI